jgi:hypothetical protein
MLTKGARREIHRAPANFQNVICDDNTRGTRRQCNPRGAIPSVAY